MGFMGIEPTLLLLITMIQHRTKNVYEIFLWCCVIKSLFFTLLNKKKINVEANASVGVLLLREITKVAVCG